ncbi:MAG: hypothetical protein FWG92_08105 [Leptospirales bacterium]|nr:hypothetical protein [Leptospirales bacterium]
MKIITAQEAAALIPDEAVIIAATFGMSGVAEETYAAIEARFLAEGSPKNITYTHAAGSGNFAPGRSRGEDHFAHPGLIKRWVASHLACSNGLTAMFDKVEGWNLPLGTLIHLYKQQARGIPFCFSKVGLGTFVDPRPGIGDGGKVTELARKSGVELVEHMNFHGEDYLVYKGLPLTHAIIRATYADEKGNISFKKSPYKLENLIVAQAAKAYKGKVIVEVEQIVPVGTIHPKDVQIPAIYVDYVVVMKDVGNALYYPGNLPWNINTTGDLRAVVAEAFTKLPLDGEKVSVRRAAMEMGIGQKCNFGIGMPQLIGSVVAEEGCSDLIVMISESGVIGGVPQPGPGFGSHINPESITEQGDHFNYFDHGGLDFGSFGLGEVDEKGGINTSMISGVLKGCGGFPNISLAAVTSVMLGAFTAGGLKTSVKDGKLVIDQEGKVRKFLKSCVQLSFNCAESIRRGKKVFYVTERAVFEGTPTGIKLIEIAPGIDLQKQVLDLMDFKPEMPEGGPKLMPAALFQENWGGLKAHWESTAKK